jgi:hypothetical protein
VSNVEGRKKAMDFKQIWEEFFATWKEIVTRPEKFFAKWDPNEEWGKVLKFCVICGLVAGVITTVLTLFSGIASLILYPIFILIGTVIGGVILFVCFKLVGGKGEIEPTIKMMGYTQAVSVVSMGIPIVGIFAALYQLWLLVVGGRKVHQLDTSHAAVAVVIPVVAIGGLLFLLALLGFGMMSLMMSGRG